LLQLKEAILDFLFDIVGELLLRADELRILGVARLLHDSTASALESLFELVDATIRHRQLLVLVDLLGGLGCDAVYGGPSRVHSLGYGWGYVCLVPGIGIVTVAYYRLILVNRVRLLAAGRLLHPRRVAGLLHL